MTSLTSELTFKLEKVDDNDSEVTVAAAEVHTGAMIALLPSRTDAHRLALDGYEEPDQLHVTLVYLGQAADFDEQARDDIIDTVWTYTSRPVEARAFAVNVFNPDGDEPCLVLGVGDGDDGLLTRLHDLLYAAVRSLEDVEVAENHTPWVPHVTLAYDNVTQLLTLVPRALERVGPVTFDRIRVAFGGENTDVPLGEVLTAADDHWKNQLRDAEGQWTDEPASGEKAHKISITERTRALDAALTTNYDQLATHRTQRDRHGVWKRERDAVHREIVDDLYEKAARVPNRGHAVLLGGSAGAGKSTVLTQAGIDLGDYLVIAPDDIKEELARRGLVPELPGGDFSPMERSTLVHQESIRIGDMLADRALRDRKNIIWDGTMGNSGLVLNRVDRMNDAGYSRVDALFVDVSDATSRRRAAARYRQGVSDYARGQGLGGRYVPVIIQNALKSDQVRSNFNYIRRKETFDNWVMYDNDVDGRPAQLVKSEGEI